MTASSSAGRSPDGSRRFTELAHRASQLEDPEKGLTATAALREQLEALEASHVDRALQAGWPWSRIAAALGVSKQAAHKKHAARLRERPTAASVPHEARARLVVTGQARRSVRLAREEAAALGRSDVGVEHLLLGLLRDGEGPAAEALASVGVTLAAAREELQRMEGEQLGTDLGRSYETGGGDERATRRLPVSVGARQVMEQSLYEAVRLGSPHLGVEHILLALLRNRTGRVSLLLARFGLSPVVVERRVDETVSATAA